MANIIRLSSGGRIQVRTGVLQGVGPEGPTGPTGPAGPDGPAGPPGDSGPTGQIQQIQTQSVVSGATTVNPNTDTLVALGSVSYDDLGIATSSTQWTVTQAGDYLFTLWLGLSASSTLDVWIQNATKATTLVRDSRTGTLYTHVAFATRVTANDQFRVYVRGVTATTVNAGALTITRTGSGPNGAPGIQGPPGEVGPRGLDGPQGIPGSAGTGYATYGALDGG